MKIDDVIICIQNDSVSIPIDDFTLIDTDPILIVGNKYIVDDISKFEIRVIGYREYFHKGLFLTLKELRKKKLKKIL